MDKPIMERNYADAEIRTAAAASRGNPKLDIPAAMAAMLAMADAVGPGSKKARPYGTYNPPKSKSKRPNHRKAQKAARKRQRGAK